MRLVASLIFFVLVFPAFARGPIVSDSNAEKSVCTYDPGVLALGIEAFDQDMNGGWRKIASELGCESVAADVIMRYRALLQSRMGLLYWHEAQLRAMMGDKPTAIALMRKSVKQDDQGFGWNDYVDASIAYLEGDKQKLLNARERLARLPIPPNRRCVDTNGKVIDCGAWPANLGVVDGLINCFSKPYKEAYGLGCKNAKNN